MTRRMRFATPVLVTAAVVAVVWVGAGDLNPPPGPIMATNRVQLNAQAISLPYAITQSGSYVLTSDLNATGPGNGIVVSASDVSLDLNGFGLFGNGGPGSGIVASGAVKNIDVRNGTVGDWGDHGIDLSGASACRVSDVRLVNNGQHGVRVGAGSTVMNCLAEGNGGAGIRAEGNRNRIELNHSLDNTRGYDLPGIENLLVKNSAANNGVDYTIAAGNGYGPIVAAVANLNSVADGTHPWANFSLSCALTTWCQDSDGDGFGNPGSTQQACTQPMGYISDCSDCNDTNPLINPTQIEVCDGQDNDCNGGTPDGSGEPSLGSPCDGPDLDQCIEGVVVCQAGSLGCSDNTGSTLETCNNIDDDCNMQIDDGLGSTTCGTGQCQNTVPNCIAGVPQTCSPGSPSAEVCDGIDNNCNGSVDEGSPCVPNAQCSGVSCACDPGYADCNGSFSLDGCEVYTPTDPNNCGGCALFCSSGICVGGACQLLANGNACSSAAQCSSGFCVDGVCCNTSCTGVCQACSAVKKGTGSNGTCGNIISGMDPDSECAGAAVCNGSGVCASPNGSACSFGGQCLSGFCVDGFCCNTPCTGLCQACSAAKNGVSNGTCASIPSGTDPDNECSFPSSNCDGTGSCGP